MGLFRVLCDGQDIYDPGTRGLALINPEVRTEAGAAGSAEFTMPANHVFYGTVVPYGSSVEVFEDGHSVFFGRPLKPFKGFWGGLTYHCEGALAFLNDSRPPRTGKRERITLHDWFSQLIRWHNSNQQKAERKLTLGNITVQDEADLYREFDISQSIMDLIKKTCIGTNGGYLFVRRENGASYIDWVQNMPYTCNQSVELAVNLVDLAMQGESDEIVTGLVAIGGEMDSTTHKKAELTTPVWMDSAFRERYGDIIGYQNWPDAKSKTALQRKARQYLNAQAIDGVMIELEAVEQHYINPAMDAFRAGQMVHAVSRYHDLVLDLPVQSVEYRLDSPASKKIVLGTIKRQTLTKIQRKDKQTIEDLTAQVEDLTAQVDDVIAQVDPISSIPPVPTVTGADGNDYAIGVDENGDIYATKCPSAIMVSVRPTKETYADGETIDYTGMEVYMLDGNGNIFTDESHPDGLLSIDELTLPVTVADYADGTRQVIPAGVAYKMKGIRSGTEYNFVTDQAFIDAAKRASIATGLSYKHIYEGKRGIWQYVGYSEHSYAFPQVFLNDSTNDYCIYGGYIVDPPEVSIPKATYYYATDLDDEHTYEYRFQDLQWYEIERTVDGETVTNTIAYNINFQNHAKRVNEDVTNLTELDLTDVIADPYCVRKLASTLALMDVGISGDGESGVAEVELPVQWLSTYNGATLEDKVTITVSREAVQTSTETETATGGGE